MKVFVAKVLIEDVNLNSCSVEVFDTLDNAKEWASNEIDSYGMEYDGAVTERADTYFAMTAGDTHVTIEIVECEVR